MKVKVENTLAYLTPVSPAFALLYYGVLTTRARQVMAGLKKDKVTFFCLCALLATGVISSLLSDAFGKGLVNSLIMPVFIGIYALGRWAIAEPKQFMKAVTTGAGLLGLVVIICKLLRLNWWWGEVPILADFHGRGNVLGIANNGLAAMLEVGVVGGFGFFLYYLQQLPEKRALRPCLGYLLLGVLALSGVFATLSRGSMIGLAAALFLLVALNLKWVKRHWKVLAALVLIVAIAVASSPKLTHRISTIFIVGMEAGEYNAGRVEIWTTTLKMLKDHLWLGVGPGQFKENYRQYMPADPIHPNVRSPHSLYLFIFSGWGVVGLALFLIWLGHVLIRPLWQKPTFYRKLALAMVASFFVHVIFNDLFVAHVPLLMGVIARPELDV
ncbi:MAG TPA: O-antigen ligase family protein [Firmicutes bacterium]|nr:O-antigen ligase family protein [Bacillota bacterium]